MHFVIQGGPRVELEAPVDKRAVSTHSMRCQCKPRYSENREEGVQAVNEGNTHRRRAVEERRSVCRHSRDMDEIRAAQK